uniref:uncharacterized protein si:dkey-29h14.10 n=1 Tax=Scatophagus argus TaxID=75038 RepID=UPI001ED81465|nr:uncharacterized protein si:dkey-29h14.10 [Scatophagus argus]
MSSYDSLALSHFNNSNFGKMKESSTFNQVMNYKATNIQRIIQVVHRMALKSCRRACQLFCCPIDSMLCERVTQFPALNDQSTKEKTTQAAHQGPPSTIMIVNISNSTLVNCAIGNDTYQPMVAESQPLMQESELQMYGQVRCSCGCGKHGSAQTSTPPPPPPPLPLTDPSNISIHGSRLNFVIIGDNNYMHAEQCEALDTQS